MKKSFIYFISLLFSFACGHRSENKEDPAQFFDLLFPAITKFYFSYPGRDVPEESKNQIRNRVIRLIREAKFEITGYIYGLNDTDILIALRSAKQRGVKLYIQGDRDEDYKDAETYGLTINRWHGTGIHHIKIWIFDQKLLFLGTGNYTKSGLIRDNNVYWEEILSLQNYNQLMSILREEHVYGYWSIANRKYYFSPEAGYQIQDMLVQAVRNAKTNIRYMIFTHYDPVLSYELVEACKRGVRVEGIYNSPVNPEGEILANHLPYPCKIYADGNVDILYSNGDYSGGLLHHKTMIIDNKKVVLGSYNYTVSARDENREFFTSFEDPSSISEFMGEWSRVRTLAQEIVSLDEEGNYEAKAFRLTPSSLNHILMANKSSPSIFFDRNSTGLSKELNQSLKLLDTMKPEDLASFDKKRDNMSEMSLHASFGWLRSDFKPVISFSIVMLWDKVEVLTNPFLELTGIHLWDGKKMPVYFPVLDSNQFPVGVFDLLKSEQWIIFETPSGFQFGCTKKKTTDSAKWIVYLQQKQILNGYTVQECKSF